MTDAEFLPKVKRYVHQIDPQAEVWLFGSRARGDARPDSEGKLCQKLFDDRNEADL